MARYESIAEAIGGTPLIRLVKTGLRPRIYVKPEWFNPGGSVKDRAALSMLRRAEADGSLRPGGTVVETTSGNTGIGLALYAAHLGYRSVIFTSSSISKEKRDLLTAHGAELRLVDVFVPKSHHDSLRSQAERFVAETPGAWLADQYDNPANPDAHYLSTGPEIWADTDQQITHLVATVGTGGTISGTGRFLKEASGGRVAVIGADPLTSRYSGGDGSGKAIEGAGHAVHPLADRDDWPKSLDLSVIDAFIAIDDAAAIATIRSVARREGVLAGGSSGVALAAALQLAESLTESDVVVVLLPDSGRAYLSTYFNDAWLAANGFGAEGGGGVAVDGGVTTVRETDAVSTTSIGWDDGVDEARAALQSDAGDDDHPVLVLYPRAGRTIAPHASDVAGWTTRRELSTAASVAAVTHGSAPKIGAGQPVDAALTAAAASDPEWQVALVLDAGRVAGAVARPALAEAAAVRAPVAAPALPQPTA